MNTVKNKLQIFLGLIIGVGLGFGIGLYTEQVRHKRQLDPGIYSLRATRPQDLQLRRTIQSVVEIANRVVEGTGRQLTNYRTPDVQFDSRRETKWIVDYTSKSDPFNKMYPEGVPVFHVSVDDETGKSQFFFDR
jgi:hypothetical protein